MTHSKELKSLSDWLTYIECLHTAEIEFGLVRVGEVCSRLFPDGLSCRVITVGGTNGKGSTCTFIEKILLEAGYSCGKNSSPHINNFNERISVNGVMVDDGSIIDAFHAVEEARKEIALTYFEYTFLAALVVFDKTDIEFAICEVGLGGRLDAVNILSPEVSVITNIGLDHTQWLGDSRELIAMEKVAISRPGKPCIIGDNDFPEGARSYLDKHLVHSLRYLKNFHINFTESVSWEIHITDSKGYFNNLVENVFIDLPLLAARHHYQNASCAILAVMSLYDIRIKRAHIHKALMTASMMGRCQVVSESPLIVLDVAHNVDSMKALAEFVKARPIIKHQQSKVIAVCSMLDDKDIDNSLSEIHEIIDEWWIAPLNVSRAASIERLQSVIHSLQDGAVVNVSDSINTAFETVKKQLKSDDCLLVFGSFFVVGDILRHHELS